MKRKILLLLVLFLSKTAHAQQSNFSISPPPIPSPYFEAGKKDKKIDLSFIYLGGKGLSFYGGGFDYIERKGWTGWSAGNYSAGVFLLKGNMNFDLGAGVGTSKGDMLFTSFPLSANLEFQPYHSPYFDSLIFFGINANFSIYTFSYSYFIPNIGTSSDTMLGVFIMLGGSSGIQFGASFAGFHITPFAVFSLLTGTGSVSSSSGGELSMDIPPFLTTSFGLDILYEPAGLSLSGLFQLTAMTKENEDFDVWTIRLGFKF